MKFIGLLLLFAVILSPLILSSCAKEPTVLTTSVTPGGGGTVSPSGGTFENGAEVTLVATPSKYYVFNGWAGDISSSSERVTVKMDTNKNIVASFVKLTPSLQLNVEPPGGGTLSQNSGNYEAGNSLDIIATPSNGYRFDHWGGNTTGTVEQVKVLMDTNKIITAYFVKQYSLKITTDPTNAGEVPAAAGLYDAGTKINLNAVPVFPYYPQTWIGADSNTNPTTVTMNSDKSVIIVFEPTIASETQYVSGALSSGEYKTNPTDSIQIELRQNEWVQGEIILGVKPPVIATIQDPNGTIIKEFGTVAQANFSFMAEVTGKYTITFSNPSIFWSRYDLSYAIFHLP